MKKKHGTMFEVVKNHEEQFSIWPSDRAIPKGWSAVGKLGTNAAGAHESRSGAAL